MSIQPTDPADTSGSQVMTNSFITANWGDNVSFLLNRPMFVGYNPSTQSVSSGTGGVAVQWTWTVADTYSGHPFSSPSRYIGQVPGWYRVSGSVCFTGNATGGRKAWIAVNGTAVPYSNVQGPPSLASGDATTLTVPETLVFLNGSTDYVEIWASQTSGTSLNLNPAATNCSGISIIWDHM